MSSDAKPARAEWRWFARELRPVAGAQTGGMAMLMVATLLSIVDPLIVKWIIDDGLQQRRWRAVVIAVAAFCILYIVRITVLSAGTMLLARTAHHTVRRLRLRILDRLQEREASFFDRHSTGDLVTRLEQEIDQLRDIAADLFPMMIRIVVAIAAIVGMMAFLDWRLAAMTVPIAFVLAFVRTRYSPLLEKASQQTRDIVGERAGFLTECLGAIVQLQLLCAERFVRRRYGRLINRSIRTSLDQLRTELRYTAVAQSVVTVAAAAVLLAGAYEVMTGVMTIGSFVAFYTYLLRLFDPLSVAAATFARLKRASGSIARLTELEDAPVPVVDNEVPAIVPPTLGEIVCSDIHVTYEGEPVLRGVNLQIRRGEKVAVMGRSGAGKSTLAKLLLRVCDPSGGMITLNGVDARNVRRRDLRRLATFVPSAPALLRGSIYDNVLLGWKHIDHAELTRLAAIAGFDSVVLRYPDGWNHQLGAAGAGLSEGEKQRLGILRALVRGGDMLILDEASGALDSKTEDALLAGLSDYARDRMVLFITHRRSPAQWADRLLILNDGELKVADDRKAEHFPIASAAT
ncbi:MAG TPA: ABC transporter ATP-binding protein [Thermoanaerobaculia bacterium]|nr:ABC transporter ATP-binding protein [Thermoanaerobaculia bacterium]